MKAKKVYSSKSKSVNEKLQWTIGESVWVMENNYPTNSIVESVTVVVSDGNPADVLYKLTGIGGYYEAKNMFSSQKKCVLGLLKFVSAPAKQIKTE